MVHLKVPLTLFLKVYGGSRLSPRKRIRIFPALGAGAVVWLLVLTSIFISFTGYTDHVPKVDSLQLITGHGALTTRAC